MPTALGELKEKIQSWGRKESALAIVGVGEEVNTIKIHIALDFEVLYLDLCCITSETNNRKKQRVQY